MNATKAYFKRRKAKPQPLRFKTAKPESVAKPRPMSEATARRLAASAIRRKANEDRMYAKAILTSKVPLKLRHEYNEYLLDKCHSTVNWSSPITEELKRCRSERRLVRKALRPWGK